MWFEAKKQEKHIRGMMVDSRRRAERRQAFYEKTRKDPAEFLQVHGSKCRIYMDANICKIAEEQGGVRPWQGDSKILIDRFDARAYLDYITEYKPEDDDLPDDDEEERQCSYERYRILIRNEFEKVSEDKFLKQIFMEERFGAIASTSNTLAKAEREQKKAAANKKAMIGFDYESNKGIQAKKKHDSSSDDGSDVESEPEFDAPIDARNVTPEHCRDLNKLGAKYGMKIGDFVGYMYDDKERQDQLSELKKVEEAKAALSGKNSRRERQILKQKRLMLMGKGMDYAKNNRIIGVAADTTVGLRSSSGSRSASPETGEGGVQYIRTFGGQPDSDPEPEPQVTHGPQLPNNEQRKLLELRKRRSRSNSLGDQRRSALSPRRRRSRSYSPRRRRRSRESRRRRSRSRSRSSHRHRRRERSRSRDKKTSNGRRRRSTSSDSTSSSRSPSPANKKGSFNEKRSPRVSQQMSPRLDSNDKKACDSDLSMLSLPSDLSDDERERREVENTKRRIKRAKIKARESATASNRNDHNISTEAPSKAGKTLSLREKLKLQTQKALKRTYIKDKEEEKERKREMEREERERDLELRELSTLQRRREREKRHKKLDERSKSREKTRSRSRSKERQKKSKMKSLHD